MSGETKISSDEMAVFRVTFGAQYPREPHPAFPAAHRDGYVAIEAPSEVEARIVALATLGTAWCDIYSPERWPQVAHYFPLGELARFVWPVVADLGDDKAAPALRDAQGGRQ